MKPQLFYVTDAYCCWCYGFSKTMNRVAQEYGDRLNIRVLNGGMIPQDMPLQALFASFNDPIALHSRISALSGQTFGDKYLDHIRTLSRSTRIVNSSVPARAMLAVKALSGENELKIATEIQNAYYRDGFDLNDVSTYRRVTSALAVDFQNFEREFNSPATDAAAKAEIAGVKRMSVRGFPALLLQHGGGLVAVAHGFTEFDSIKHVLDTKLSENTEGAALVSGSSCNVDGSGCN